MDRIDKKPIISQLNLIFSPCIVDTGSLRINQKGNILYFELFDPSEDISFSMLEKLSKFINSTHINFKECCGCDSGSQGSTKYIYFDCLQVDFKSLTYLYDPNDIS
jgi:hypothetical protein